MSLPNPIIISDTRGLQSLASSLNREPLIAFDTESNSLFAYKERVCLIQVSTRENDWVIDPLLLDSLEPLRPLFADPGIEKVFHAAEYDLMCLKRDYQFEFSNLFDTMFAARVLGRKQFGLGSLLEEFFGVQTDKKYQRADWSVRPIPEEQLRYAQLDTHYLPQLRDFLRDELLDRNRLIEATEMFDGLTRVVPPDNSFDEEGYWRFNGAREFNRRQMAILRELYLWRDRAAQSQDVPPFKVMGDNTLIAIVQMTPHNIRDLQQIRELTPYQLRRYGNAILDAVENGIKAPPPARPDRPRPVAPEVQARYDALHIWRKERASERGVESDIILSKESMWAMARVPPTSVPDLDRVPGLGPWRRDEYGVELLRVVAEADAQTSLMEDADDA